MTATKRVLHVLLIGVASGLHIPATSAQSVIDRGHSSDGYSPRGDQDSSGDGVQVLRRSDRSHDDRELRQLRHRNVGPRDAIQLVRQRGYHVRSVEDVGERFLVRATRGGRNLMVSVSRHGEIMGVVRDN